jgi:ABC-type transport system involved in multi-copper enzyme maturation permease subunit
MRALFVKELKQGRPLLIFAAVMGVLLVAAHAAVGRFLLLYSGALEPEVLSYAFGIAAAAVVPLFAIFASSGILSGEAHAGTLPVLFGLPLSRLRIWAAMALAALVLSAGGGVLVLIITRIALRSPFVSLSLSAHLPDAICFAVFLLSVGLFCSSLARSVTAALACAVLLAGGFTGGASALVFYYGAPITGLPILDLALWCFVCTPALLLGSALAITRGELLTGFRKWLYSIPVTVVALALTVVVVCGAARMGTDYRRAAVHVVDALEFTPGGKVLALMTAGGGFAVPRARGDLLTAEPLQEPTLGAMLRELRGSFRSYTRVYGIALDLETGKEALVERAFGPKLSGPGFSMGYSSGPGMSMGCSADGRWVATLTARQGLTWGRNEGAPIELRIYDAQARRLVARGDPDLLSISDWHAQLLWSPTGGYLSVVRGSYGGWRDRKVVIRVVGRDAKPLSKGPVILESACWSPVEDVFYGIDANGAVCRLSPDGRQKEVIWSPVPGMRKADRWFDRESISPDGNWIVMRDVVEEIDPRGAARGRVDAIRLIDTRSGESETLWRAQTSYANPGRYLEDSSSTAMRWSSDGQTLHALRNYRDKWARSQITLRHYQLMRWSPGERGLEPIGAEIEASHVRLLVPPGSDEALLWVWQQEWGQPDEQGFVPNPRTISEELWSVSREGQVKQLPVAEWPGFRGTPGRELGFDNRGRLIYLAAEESESGAVAEALVYRSVEALDLTTGKVDRIYP